MKDYIKERLLGLAIVLLGVSVLTFALIALSGTDPAKVIALRGGGGATEELLEQIREELGLVGGAPQRYLRWLGGLFIGDFGFSTYSFRPVAEDLAAYFPTTLALVGLSLLWIVAVSVLVGLLCAHRQNGLLDQIARGVTVLGICLPTFWLGFLLLLAFAVKLPIFTVAPEPGIKGLMLPSFALAIPLSCSFVRLLRASLLGELHRDYVEFARARGLSPWRILVGHVLRNALPPIITLFCQQLGYLIVGSAVVESVFSLKGIGSYLLACVTAADATAVAGCMIIVASVFVLGNLFGDILGRILCPWMVRETND